MCAANEWSKQTEWLASTGKLPKCIYRLHSCPGFCLSTLGWIQSTVFLKSHHKYSWKQQNESRSMYMVSKHPAIELHTPRKPFQVDIISSAISQQYAALVQKHQAWSMTFRCTEWRKFEGMEQGGKSQGPGCLESFWAWKQYLSLVRGGARCQKKILFKDEWTWEGLSK